jgi:hypothetical protein
MEGLAQYGFRRMSKPSKRRDNRRAGCNHSRKPAGIAVVGFPSANMLIFPWASNGDLAPVTGMLALPDCNRDRAGWAVISAR